MRCEAVPDLRVALASGGETALGVSVCQQLCSVSRHEPSAYCSFPSNSSASASSAATCAPSDTGQRGEKRREDRDVVADDPCLLLAGLCAPWPWALSTAASLLKLLAHERTRVGVRQVFGEVAIQCHAGGGGGSSLARCVLLYSNRSRRLSDPVQGGSMMATVPQSSLPCCNLSSMLLGARRHEAIQLVVHPPGPLSDDGVPTLPGWQMRRKHHSQ